MDKNMIIKVCGMTDEANIQAVEQLGADLIGMVFYPKSPRYVSLIRSRAGLTPDYSRERLERLEQTLTAAPSPTSGEPSRAGRVGVFVDEMPQTIVTRVYNHHLGYVQLHGHESAVMCGNLRRTLDPDICPGVRIIKAISVVCPEDIDAWRQYRGVVDMLLFDTHCGEVGGSGRQFDWTMLSRYDGDIPFLLSGGIGPGDVERLRAFSHPRWAGIDLNSQFELSPGVKDIDRLRTFINAIRNE